MKFNDNSGAEDEDLHSEPAEDLENGSGKPVSENGEDVPEKNVDETERSVTIEEITGGLPPCGNVDHLRSRIPKRPQSGSEPANLDNTEVIVTSEPNAKPPFIEVAEKNYLDIFDEI